MVAFFHNLLHFIEVNRAICHNIWGQVKLWMGATAKTLQCVLCSILQNKINMPTGNKWHFRSGLGHQRFIVISAQFPEGLLFTGIVLPFLLKKH
jgi:hypothetical protein